MTKGICRFCGEIGEGVLFETWVKPTFTDHDKLQLGEIVCAACLFWFDEVNQDLADYMGRDVPQRFRSRSLARNHQSL